MLGLKAGRRCPTWLNATGRLKDWQIRGFGCHRAFRLDSAEVDAAASNRPLRDVSPGLVQRILLKT
jgi:hypothetical protein